MLHKIEIENPSILYNILKYLLISKQFLFFGREVVRALSDEDTVPEMNDKMTTGGIRPDRCSERCDNKNIIFRFRKSCVFYYRPGPLNGKNQQQCE